MKNMKKPSAVIGNFILFILGRNLVNVGRLLFKHKVSLDTREGTLQRNSRQIGRVRKLSRENTISQSIRKFIQ